MKEDESKEEQAPISSARSMDTALFHKFRNIAYEKAGIAIKDGKEVMVSARIFKRMRALGIDSHRNYLRYLEADTSGEELVNFLDSISTNFTSFFREREHFEVLRDYSTQWLKQGQMRFRFWSAACSSGEEPYSMAMVLSDIMNETKFADMKILATDISTVALMKAKRGVYPLKALGNLSLGHKQTYFECAEGERYVSARVKEELKRMIVFKRFNLATPPYPMSGPFDIILCRNVMIYFDREVRQRFISEAERLLKTGGLLMIGHSETLMGIKSSLKIIRPSIYIKPD